MHQRLEHLLYLGRSTAQIISWKLSRRFRNGQHGGRHLGKGAAAYQRQPLSLMGLEQRLLMSAVPLDVIEAGETEGLDGPLLIQGDAGMTEAEGPAAEDAAQAGAVLVFLDPSVTDFDAVLASLTANTPEADIYLLSDNSSGVEQITDVLSERSDVHSLHIVAGTEGVNSVFGSEDLDQTTLNQYVGSIAAWNDSLYNAGEIHFYDTDFASSIEGQTFMQVMELLTGATVSEDNSSNLRTQVQSSLVESDAVISWDVVQQDSIVVTTTSDVNDVGLASFDRDYLMANRGADGEISLREAIIAANNSLGLDRIAFDIGDAQPDEISLQSALPEITDAVAIDGHAANATEPMPGVSLQGNDLAIDGLVLGVGSDGSYLIGLSVMNLGGSGIVIESANNVIAGNWLGGLSLSTGLADSDLAIAVDGLRVRSDGNLIGGRSDYEQNVLGAIDGNAIALVDASNNEMIGNRIGVTPSQPNAAAVGQSGIRLSGDSDGNQIGQRGAGNLIAFTGSNGITIVDQSDSNLLRFNRIVAFSGLAIDLGDDGRNVNDSLDADVGPNELLNAVQLNAASIDTQGALDVTFSLQAQASASYNVDFYLSDGQGQLRRFLGQQAVSTDGLGDYSGVANLNTNGLDGSNYLSAIVTDQAGNSSEAAVASQLIEDNNAPVLTATPHPDPTFVEDGPALIVFPDVQLTDDGELSGATIEVAFNPSSDVRLQFVGTDSIVGSWDAAAGKFTLSGQASAAEYEAAIEQIELVNYTNRVGTEFVIATLTVYDRFDQSAAVPQFISIQHIANNLTGDVELSGPVVVGATATVDISAVSDPELADNIVVNWYLDGAYFLTSDEFTPTNDQLGQTVAAQVLFTNAFGDIRTRWTESVVILGPNQPAVGVPVVTGVVAEDQWLSVNLDGISDPDGMTTSMFSYQWLRDGSAIAGATGDQYKLGDADVDAQIQVEVSFADDRGAVNTLRSTATAAVANVDDAPVGVPAITGIATEDQTLGVDLSGVSDADGLTTAVFSFQWYRDGAAILGATGDEYKLADADVDTQIHVQVSFTDDRGGVHTLSSSTTANVANVDDAPAGLPVITGVVSEDQTLGVDLSGISDADGMTTSVFTYQWYRDGSIIAGATANQYTLGDVDVDAKISVEVSFTDDRGGANTLTSLATSEVTNVDDPATGLPLITGLATEDQTLGVDLSGISDADGMTTSVFTYQWYRDGSAIAGATGDQYTLGDADVDATISVEVSFADDRGGLNTLQSAASGAVVNVDDAPTGLPVITGVATEDQTLGVDLSGISDADGMTTSVFTYQWYRDGSAIAGATGDQYTLGDGDVDAAISVEVSFTDDRGGLNTLQSVATSAVVNIDDAPAGLPVITGVATEDQTLGVDLSGISDPDGMTTSVFTYQWYRDGSAIVGTTGDQYTLGDDDVDAAISVEVSFADDRGGANTLQSAATSAVVNVDDAPAGLPVITGVATEDQTLGVDLSGISDADGMTTSVFAYQWYRDGSAIVGATGGQYTLGDADVGAEISVEVSFTDDRAGLNNLQSAATAVVVNVDDAPAGLPVITGIATEDQTLSVDLSGVSDADGMTTSVFTYQWYRDGSAIAGANGDQYTLGDADVDAEISVEVSFTDDRGGVNMLQSVATAAVVNVDDAATGLPMITGVATEDQTLGVDLSGVSDADGMTTSVFTYQWYRDGSAIIGATGDQYTLGDADVDATISVEVSFADDRGGLNTLQSAATSAVVNVDDAPAGLPVITGIATEDQTLSVDLSGISDADGMTTSVFTYQWYRDGSAIVGATGDQYTLGDADVDAAISVEVSFTDDRGGANALQSAATSAVVNIDDAPAGLPVITGVATEDQTLGVDLSGISDADGMTTSVFTYQWYRDGSVIAGATGDQYTLGDEDVDAAISVEVRFTDDRGGVNTLQSVATTAVVNVDDAPTGLPVVTGVAAEDQSLGVDLSGISDADGMTTSVFTYQWYRDGSAIVGATGDQYALGNADVDAAISVEVSFTDDRGGANTLQSAATSAVVNVDDAPAGLPVITGVATEDQTLGVDLSGVSDADGTTTSVFTYQWYRDGSVIAGATGDQYTLGDADVDATISVEVSFSDDRGGLNTLISAATAAVVNVDDAPVGLPSITGVATEDQTLGVDLSGISDADGMTTSVFTYQWYRDGAAIAGATGDQYTLGDADVDATISVEVSFTDDRGGVNTLQSAATSTVLNVDDAPTGLPVITGIATEDQTLSVNLSGISDADGMTTSVFAYQWYRDGTAIVGATGDQYTLGDADVDAAISVEVSFADDRGGANTLQSAATAAVVNVDDAPAGLPVISGVATEDQTLSVDLSGISDADGMTTSVFAYQWYRDGSAIVGATGDQYTLGDADVDAEISVEVSFTDDRGGVNTLQSVATAAVVNVDDAPVGLPVITGVATEDQTLSVDLSGIVDADGMKTSVFTYQWYRDGAVIAGATGDQYTLGDADVDAAITVEVSFSDDRGGVNTLQSVATSAVVNVDDAPTGLPVITGVATEDQTLGVDLSGISDADGMTTSVFTYQWYRDGSAIAGATGDQYTLGDADVDAAISVEVSFTDDRGGANTLQSAATAAVVNVDDAPVGLPSITGVATEDQTLGIDLSGISDADGMTTSLFTYQWYRNGSAIVGATGDQYTLGDADVDAAISVEVSFTDDRGGANTLQSVATSAVVNVDDAPAGLPVITGVATEDQTLGVDLSGISDADGMTTSVFTYQWYRDGSAIVGATGDQYTLDDADVDAAISVEVSFADDRGGANTLQSAATSAVVNVDDAPAGLPVITGVATEDQTLGVGLSGISDADGLTTSVFTYQWYRDGSTIVGATGDQYTLGDADVDATISVEVSFTDNRGGANTLQSAATSAVVNVDDTPTGLPVITGVATEDQTLSVDLSGISDADGMTTSVFSYQWYRDGSAIVGATGDQFTLSDADVDATISVEVSFTDDRGGANTLQSVATSAVVNVDDAAVGLPVITGVATEDQTLGVDLSGISDADGMTTSVFTYQWFRDGSLIAGATGDQYTLGDADVDAAISVEVSFADDRGGVNALQSVATSAVVNIDDAPVGLPSITGVATEDQTLGVDLSGISDSDGMTTSVFTYQWYRDGSAIAGATSDQYTLGDADVGAEISVEVSFTDDRGGVNALRSGATAAVANMDDTPTGLPVITGSAIEDQTLSVDLSGISDMDGLTTSVYTYQWYRDGLAIVGATSDQFTLGDADVDCQIHVEVSFSDDQGASNVLASEVSPVVQNIDDAPTGLPTIVGSAIEDQVLSVDTSLIQDADGIQNVVFNYQWYRDGVLVFGETGDSYTLGDEDVDSLITVEVEFTDDRGAVARLMSLATGAVVNVDDDAVGLPLINGVTIEDQLLGVDTSQITDADGLSNVTFSYQWYRDQVAIAGSTTDQLLLSDVDVDAQISVAVTFTDDRGMQYTRTSELTGPVKNLDDSVTGQPVIVGQAIEDQPLSLDLSGIADADGMQNAVFSYQWYSDGLVIDGATDATYTPTDADFGKEISVLVSFFDDRGGRSVTLSQPTDLVQGINDAPAGVPVMVGTFVEEEVLYADISGIVDPDGLPSGYQYQWFKDGVAISGATQQAYTLTIDDVGQRVSVQVEYVDLQGTREVLRSAESPEIDNINDPPELQNLRFEIRFGETLDAGAEFFQQQAFDIDGDALQAIVVSTPTSGTLEAQPDGSFVFTPATGFFGEVTFSWVASDGEFISEAASVTIVIAPPIDTALPPDEGGGTGTSQPGSSGGQGTPDANDEGLSQSDLDQLKSDGADNGGDASLGGVQAIEDISDEQFESSLLVFAYASDATQQGADGYEVDARAHSLKPLLAEQSHNQSSISLYTEVAETVADSIDWAHYNFAEVNRHIWEQLNYSESHLSTILRNRQLLAGSFGAATGGIAVVIVSWLRNSVLLLGVLQQRPIWSSMDPLLLIQGLRNQDTETLEDVFKDQKEKLYGSGETVV